MNYKHIRKALSIPKLSAISILLISLAFGIFSSCYIPRNGLYENDIGTRYFENDIYKTGWIEIDEKMYYFSALDGYMIKKPTVLSGQMYYFNSDGTLVNGFYDYTDENGSCNTVYCDSGRAMKGWQTVQGKRYYFYLDTGYMAKGEALIGGEHYIFNADGSLKEFE